MLLLPLAPLASAFSFAVMVRSFSGAGVVGDVMNSLVSSLSSRLLFFSWAAASMLPLSPLVSFIFCYLRFVGLAGIFASVLRSSLQPSPGFHLVSANSE